MKSLAEVFIFGDSHIGAILQLHDHMPDLFLSAFGGHARVSYVDTGTIMYSFTLEVGKKSGLSLNPIVLMVFEQYGLYVRPMEQWRNSDKTLVFGIGFADTHVLGFDWRWQGFKFAEADCDYGDATLLSTSLVNETLRSRLQPYLEGLRQIKSQGFRIIQIAGPPPHKDARGGGGSPFVPSASFRSALYSEIVQIYDQELAELDIEFLKVGFLADDEGLLRPEFENDGVHINRDGALQILKALRYQIDKY